MNGGRTILILLAGICLGGAAVRAGPAPDQTTYHDDVFPIFQNNCLNCHNSDKAKAGLDLSSYTRAMAGSDDRKVIKPGDPSDSVLYRAVLQVEDPKMPPRGAKLSERELDVIRRWIEGGALESRGGRAVAVRAEVDLTIGAGAVGRPDGPPVMPVNLPLEPLVHTARPGALTALAASPWAPLVAVAGQRQVLLYHTQTLDLLGCLPFPEGIPYVLQFSRNGKLLLAGGGIAAKSGVVVVWDVATGKRILEQGGEFDSVLAADLNADQSLLALGGPGKAVKIFSTRTGQPLHVIRKPTDWVLSLAFSPDSALLADGDRNGGLSVWESRTGQEYYNLAGHKAAVTAVCFRDDSTILATGGEDGTVKLWDMRSGTQVKSWPAHAGGVLSVNFAHDGRLVSCGRDRTVRVWNPKGSSLRAMNPFPDIAVAAVFDCDGKRVIAGDYSGQIRVYDLATGAVVGRLSSNPPALADRLATAQQRLADAQRAAQQADARHDDAAAAKAGQELAAAQTEVMRLKTAQANLAPHADQPTR